MNQFYAPTESSSLKPIYEKIDDNSTLIQAAEPFTVEMRMVMVGPDLDGWPCGDNDVLVATSSRLGNTPMVDRIHLYRENLPAQTAIGPFLANTIFLCDDYDGTSDFVMDLKVIEVDRDLGERAEILQGFDGLCQSIGAIFPAAMPYTAAANILAKAADGLIDMLQTNERVIDTNPLRLYGPGRLGDKLRTGIYVVFSKPVAPNTFRLRGDFTLEWAPGSVWDRDLSYAVYTIERVKSTSASYMEGQRTAQLLTQLKNGNRKNVVKAGLDFAMETLHGYSIFKDMSRMNELNAKSNRTPAEDERLAELQNKLAAYIPGQ